jgi:F-box associated protein
MAVFRPGLSSIDLPLEIIQSIGFNLPLKGSLLCSLVSKAWHRALHHESFWQALSKRDFCLISQQTTGYEKLYRRFYLIRSSLLINPQPITLKGLKAHNPQLICVYTGKTGILPQFEPLGEIRSGQAIKNLYKKLSKSPSKIEKWVGKIGSPLGILRTESHSTRTRTKVDMGIDSMKEKLASDLYQELASRANRLLILSHSGIGSRKIGLLKIFTIVKESCPNSSKAMKI